MLPNETLVRVHLFNFIGWLALYAIDNFLLLKHDSLRKELSDMPASEKDSATYDQVYVKVEQYCFYQTIGNIVENIFELYMTCFLLYLVFRFAREGKNAET